MIDYNSIYQKLTNVNIEQQKQLWDERGKGYYGEYLVFCDLYQNLRGDCKILMNINIPSENGRTTEIDLLLIHETGLYVFEIKHYKGAIYGKTHEQHWTQYFRTAPNQRFLNPVIQNQYHIDVLRKHIPNIPIHSFVVFTNDECDLKVECNDPNVTLCTLPNLKHSLGRQTERPPFLDRDCIDHIFCKLLTYSPAMQSETVFEGKEIPFHEFASEISKNYANKIRQLEADYHTRINREIKNCEYETNRAKNKVAIFKAIAIVVALLSVLLSGAFCVAYSKQCTEQIAASQQELNVFAQKFEEVRDFDNGELIIAKDLVTASDIVLEPSSDIENAASFSCSLVWNGENYGVSIGENAVLIVILKDGTVKEYPIYNERYPYTSDCRLGTYRRKITILPHEFYDIAVSSIAYIKLANADIWTNVNYQYKIIASGYEVELYKAE